MLAELHCDYPEESNLIGQLIEVNAQPLQLPPEADLWLCVLGLAIIEARAGDNDAESYLFNRRRRDVGSVRWICRYLRIDYHDLICRIVRQWDKIPQKQPRSLIRLAKAAERVR